MKLPAFLSLLTPVGNQLVAASVVSSVLGLGLGALLWYPREHAAPETPQPQVRQSDSSLILGRVPDASAKAPAAIPNGQKLERIDKVVVDRGQPLIVHDTIRVPADSGVAPARIVVKVDTVTCPPVEVDLTTTLLKDGSHRVIASSPNGHIFSGVDVPVLTVTPPRVLRWVAGVAKNTLDASYSAFVQRDLGPLVVYGDVAPKQGLAPARLALGLGLRF